MFYPYDDQGQYEADQAYEQEQEGLANLNAQGEAEAAMAEADCRAREEWQEKREKKIQSFLAYLKSHPDERFWQALRNWAGVDFIFFGEGTHDDPELTDTFYLED